MPHIHKCRICLYDVCSWILRCSATTAVEEYRRRFPMRRIPDRTVFYKVFNTLRECGTLPNAHVSSERARKQNMEEQENILIWYSVALVLAREDF